ncbi:hypothetical protein VUR80DRAFT_9500 [Thermomyces stellatus]
MRVLNPDPRESSGIDADNGKEDVEDKDDAPAKRRASIFGKAEDISWTKEKAFEPEEKDNEGGIWPNLAESSAAIEKSSPQISASEAASVLCFMATSDSDNKASEEKLVSKEEVRAQGATTSDESDAEAAPRLDATGGLPTLGPDSSRPTVASNVSSDMREDRKANAADEQSGVLSEVRRRSSPSAGVSSTADNVQHSNVAENLPASRPSAHPNSSTAPTSLVPLSASLPLPRVLAAPRRQTSELYMNVPAPRHSGHPRADRQLPENFARPFHRQGEYPARLADPGPERPTVRDNDGSHGDRYQAYPARQNPTRQSHGQPNGRGSGSRTSSRQPQSNYNQAGQAPSSARQPYVQAYHTRVYHPHRVNLPHPAVQRPANTARPHRSVAELESGPQPQPAYRTYQGALDLSRGNNIARRNFASSSAESSDYGARGQHAPSVPRSEDSESWGDQQTYGHGSRASSRAPSSSRGDLPLRPQRH